MKTCFINNLYPPHAVGGAEQVVRQRALDAVKKGDAAIITSAPWSGWGSWRPIKTVEEGIVIYRFWVPNICWYRKLSKHHFLFKLLWHKIDIWNLWSTKIVQQIILSEMPDVIETHNLMGVGFGIPRMIQRLGIKHVHYLHDVQLVEPSGVLPWDHEKDTVLQKMYSWVMRRRMGEPDVVVSPSEFLKGFYLKRGFFKQSVFCHPEPGPQSGEGSFSRSKDGDKKDSSPRSAWTQNDKRKKTFLFVGSLVKHKGILVLIEAWRGLPKDLHIKLAIVGDGPLRGDVAKLTQQDSRVTYHGRLVSVDLNKLYDASDTLIFPSICLENRPTVIVEALQQGLKIIASDTGGVKELISGELVRPGDVEALRASIAKVA